jgi:Flp pilus assembly protein TadD
MKMPDEALVTNTMASAAERSGDLVAAQQYYGKAIADGKGSQETYERRGEILLTLGQPQDAANVFDAALRAGFDTPAIRRGYGRALAWLGQGAPSLVQYDAALAKDPGDARAMNGRGVALDMLGRHDEAQAQYRAAMTAAPGDLAVQNNLAMSYALTGRIDEAVAILEAINATGVASVQHRQNLALLYGLQGKTAKAEALASRDLPPEEVAQNMAAYATFQHLYEGDRPPAAPKVQSPPVTSAPLPPAAAEPPSAATASAAPSRSAAIAPVAPKQPWVLDLGLFQSDDAARDAWQRLKQAEQETLAQTVHYLENEGAGKRLLAGPFWGEDAAMNACAAIRAAGAACDPRRASAVRSGPTGPTSDAGGPHPQ